MAFLDLSPWSEGHALVVPKRHAVDILDVSPADAAAVARMVAEVAKLLDRALHPDGINVLQNNGRAAGQIVFHYHVHLIPRREGDGLFKGNRPGPIQREILREIGARLRSAVEER